MSGSGDSGDPNDPTDPASSKSLFAWGNGVLSPSRLGSDNWRSVSARYHVLAIRSDGKLFGGGSNQYGQLGTGSLANEEFPTQIGTSAWSKVSTGTRHTLAIRSDGKLFAWGNNEFGQLGIGAGMGDKYSPTQVGTSNWVEVAASAGINYSHSLAIRSDGKLFGWGNNRSGQVGDGTFSGDRMSPVQIGNSNWLKVVAGQEFSLALRSDGALFSWGRNTDGQLGEGVPSTTLRISPNQVGTSVWSNIAAGLSHSLAIRNDGKLFAWGNNNWGQVGDGTTTVRGAPVQLGSSNWTGLAAGIEHSLAIRSDGKLFAWGYNGGGLLGDGTVNQQKTPVQIGLGAWESVAAGGFQSFAIRA